MAQTYEQWKKSYESLDSAQKKLYADTISSKWADYIGNKYLAQYNSAGATSTPKVETVTYKWKVSDNPNTSWTSNMNSMSQTKAQDNSRNFQVGTGDVVDRINQVWQQLQTTKQQLDQTAQQVADRWNLLSPEQQQAALTKKGMLDYVNSKWLTIKKEEPAATTTTPTTTKKATTTQTPKQQQWDYQDNSQARMNEILNNLNGYRQTNPELFKDASAFYTFFIDGKGRSQDQIDYLWDYYNNVQKYWKYDNMPASSLWDWLANWTIPKDYLDYLKSTDPAKYQEVLSYKQDSEDRIKNENYLDELSSMAWYESEESNVNVYPDAVTYAREMWYFVDENWDWVDDNLYIQPTAEERQDVDRINEINARRMEIKNMQKNLLDDLVEQYPWVPKATLMWIVQDRTKDISREYDDLWVELVQLQGTVDYLQNERDMQAEARQKTINNLDDAYWMYYQYSPWGLAELAQSKYAATNITLDQADSWNETQKQMALQNVLDGYYEKYWDIIQRSEQQVINDVIAYAKKNWIWLAQALQENFITPLQQKPWFNQLNTATSDAISWTKIWEDADWNAIYGFVDTYNKTVTPYWNASSSWISTTYDTSTRPWKANTIKEIVSYDWTDDLWWVVSDIYSKFKWQNYWECGYLVNDYYKAVTWDTDNLITGTFKDRKGLFTKNTPSVWDIVLFDWTNSPTASDKMKTYWHVALVEWMDDTGIWVVDANWDWNWTVDRRHINYDDALYQDRVYWFYTIPEWDRQDTAVVDMWYINTPEAINAFEEFNKLWSKWLDTTAKQKRAKELFALLWTDENGFKRMADAYWDDQNAQQAEKNIEMIDKLLATADDLPDLKMRSRLWTPNSYWTLRNQADWWYWTLATAAIESMDEEELAAYNKRASDYDMLMANLMYDKYKEIKSTWWTFWSMSNAEWDNLKQAASNLKFNQDVETYRTNLEALKKEFQNLKWYGAWKASTKNSLAWTNKTSTMDSLLGRFSSY